MEDSGFKLVEISSESESEDYPSKILTSQESQDILEESEEEYEDESESDEDFEPRRRKRSIALLDSEDEDEDVHELLEGDKDSRATINSREDKGVDSEDDSRDAVYVVEEDSRDQFGDDENSDPDFMPNHLQRRALTSKNTELPKNQPAKKLKIVEEQEKREPLVDEQREPELKAVDYDKLSCPKFFYDGKCWNFEVYGHTFPKSEGDKKEGKLRCDLCGLVVVVNNGKTIIYSNPNSPSIAECDYAQEGRIFKEIKTTELEFGKNDKDAYILYTNRKFDLKVELSNTASLQFHSKKYVLYSAKLALDSGWRFFIDKRISEDGPGRHKLIDRANIKETVADIIQGITLQEGSIQGVTRTLCYEIIAHFKTKRIFKADEMWGRRVTDRAVLIDPLTKITSSNALKHFKFEVYKDEGYYLNEKFYHAYYKGGHRYKVMYLEKIKKFKCSKKFRCPGLGSIVPGIGLVLEKEHDGHPTVKGNEDLRKREFRPKKLLHIGTTKLSPAFTDEKHTFIAEKRTLLKSRKGSKDTHVTEFISADSCRAWYMGGKFFRETRTQCNAKAMKKTIPENHIHPITSIAAWESCFKNVWAKDRIVRSRVDLELKCTMPSPCKRLFETKEKLRMHLTKALDTKATFQCESCCEKYLTKKGLKQHITLIHQGFEEKVKKCLMAYKPQHPVNKIKWENDSSTLSSSNEPVKSRDKETVTRISIVPASRTFTSKHLLSKIFKILDPELIRKDCSEKYQNFIERKLTESEAVETKFVWCMIKGHEQNIRFNVPLGTFQVSNFMPHQSKFEGTFNTRISPGGWATLCSNEKCLTMLRISDDANLCVRHNNTSNHIALCYTVVSTTNTPLGIWTDVVSSVSAIGDGDLKKIYESIHALDPAGCNLIKSAGRGDYYFLSWREFTGLNGYWYALRERIHYKIVSFIKHKVVQISTEGLEGFEACPNYIEIPDKRMIRHLGQSLEQNGLKFAFLDREGFVKWKKEESEAEADWGAVWDSYRKRAWTDAHPTTVHSGSFCFCSTDIANRHRVYDCISCKLKKEYVGASNSSLSRVIATCHQSSKSTLKREILNHDDQPFMSILTYVSQAEVHKLESLMHFLLLLGYAYDQERSFELDGQTIRTSAVPIMTIFETSPEKFEDKLIQDGAFILFDKYLRIQYEGWDFKGDCSDYIQEWMKPLDLPLDAPPDIKSFVEDDSDDED